MREEQSEVQTIAGLIRLIASVTRELTNVCRSDCGEMVALADDLDVLARRYDALSGCSRWGETARDGLQ